MRLLTIGHSSRPIEEFLRMLTAHGVEVLVDVRKMPYSRKNPQFGREALAAALAASGIEYRHMPGLGGLRHTRKDSINTSLDTSPNTGWRNLSFRSYADYMQTEEFAKNLAELARLETRTAAIMCAEAVPWRCHRSLIADALTARAIRVHDIMSVKQATLHRLPDFARVEDGRVTYPGPGAGGLQPTAD